MRLPWDPSAQCTAACIFQHTQHVAGHGVVCIICKCCCTLDTVSQQVTPAQKRVIADWGKSFLGKVDTVAPGLSSWVQGLSPIPLWTDFAGGEAPVWALKEMGVKILHVACSEIASGPQKFLFRNLNPPVFYNNMFQRNHAVPFPKPLCAPVILTSGFPCRAFSALRSGHTGLLQDKEAQGCWQMLETAKASLKCKCCMFLHHINMQQDV